MSRKKILTLLSTSIIFELFIIVILFFNNLAFYNIFVFVLLIITVGYLASYCWNTRNDVAIYKSTLTEILKNYNSILVKIVSLPDFGTRHLIKVAELDDLIVAQMELRKPILYFEELDSCTFILLDEQEAYIYSLKRNASVRPIVDNYIANCRKEVCKTYSNLLSDIDRTTIIKLENSKSYKISPIRKNKNQENEMFSLDNEII